MDLQTIQDCIVQKGGPWATKRSCGWRSEGNVFTRDFLTNMNASLNGYRNPYTHSRRWLRGNLHAHTCCGRCMEIAISGPMYASLGYDFLAITDHNKALDATQWSQWQDRANLILVPGEENGTTDHIVEIGVHEVTCTPDEMYADRARILRQAGGFIVGAHPQEYPHGAENIRAAADELHAFEIFNGLREARGCDEFANIALWDELLTDGKQIWGVAVDDFHCDYITPGHGWVWVQIPENPTSVTWSTIVDQLKAGAFYATTYPRIRCVYHEHGTLHVHGDQHTQRLKVIGPGGDTLYEVQSNQLKWQPPVGLAYFRVEAECGLKRAWSQPFYESPPHYI